MSGGIRPGPRWLAEVVLPGLMTSAGRPGVPVPGGETPREAAVLVLLSDDPTGVVLTRRSAAMRSHPGQVAFPGGRAEAGDGSPAGTALREAAEETGVDPSTVTVAGSLEPLPVPPSGHTVTVVMGWWETPAPLHAADPAEVDAVSVVALADLAAADHRVEVRHPSGFTGPAFDLPERVTPGAPGGLFVWGFTAWVLDRLLVATGHDRPWDRTRRVDLPVSVGGR